MAEEYFSCHGPSLRTLPNCGSSGHQSRCRSTTYPGDVSDTELYAMALSANVCKKNNEKVLRRREAAEDGTSVPHHSRSLRKNATFLVKSENSAHYCGGLRTPVPLDLQPSAVCPDGLRHLGLVESLPLTVACPTCWSAQRIPGRKAAAAGHASSPTSSDSHTSAP